MANGEERAVSRREADCCETNTISAFRASRTLVFTDTSEWLAVTDTSEGLAITDTSEWLAVTGARTLVHATDRNQKGTCTLVVVIDRKAVAVARSCIKQSIK